MKNININSDKIKKIVSFTTGIALMFSSMGAANALTKTDETSANSMVTSDIIKDNKISYDEFITGSDAWYKYFTSRGLNSDNLEQRTRDFFFATYMDMFDKTLINQLQGEGLISIDNTAIETSVIDMINEIIGRNATLLAYKKNNMEYDLNKFIYLSDIMLSENGQNQMNVVEPMLIQFANNEKLGEDRNLVGDTQNYTNYEDMYYYLVGYENFSNGLSIGSLSQGERMLSEAIFGSELQSVALAKKIEENTVDYDAYLVYAQNQNDKNAMDNLNDEEIINMQTVINNATVNMRADLHNCINSKSR